MEKSVKDLWAEAREFTGAGEVHRLELPPSPLQFLRDYVTPNKPVIISGATRHWPAIAGDLWSDDAYLRRKLRDHSVSVHLTPDGRADAIVNVDSASDDKLCFASAFVQSMDFSSALDLVEQTGDESSPVVAYLQQQDDCLRTEYETLTSDIDPDISFATESFGFLPEAVNLWIGNGRSETSFHKDHYENLYAVITGSKHFVLLPPTETHRLYVKPYPVANYVMNDNKLELEFEEDEQGERRMVPWCSVDPFPSSQEEMNEQKSLFPLYFDGPKPIYCTVNPGEILYLPSMWFHYVRQSPDENGRCIAVNYWYDMQFDIKYAYFNFLQSIHLPSLPAPSVEQSEDKLYIHGL